MSWQLLSSGVGVWQRRSLLLKLSGQTQLLEELAEISVDRLGAVSSAADGKSKRNENVFDVDCSVIKFKVLSVWPAVFVTFPQSSRASPSALS